MSSISLKLGYKYLRSNKGGMFSFTTILAVIGLMIGISSLIVVTSVMNGLEKELQDRILGVVPHVLIHSDKPINDYETLVNKLENNPLVVQASPYIQLQALASHGTKSRGIMLTGIDSYKEEDMSMV